MADDIDFQLIGDDLQAVIITLDPGEMVQAEAGSMMYMQDGIVMNTTLDPNAQGGGMLGKLFQGAKRALSGDTFFVTTFANSANKRQDVAFSSYYPGKILPVDLRLSAHPPKSASATAPGLRHRWAWALLAGRPRPDRVAIRGP